MKLLTKIDFYAIPNLDANGESFFVFIVFESGIT